MLWAVMAGILPALIMHSPCTVRPQASTRIQNSSSASKLERTMGEYPARVRALQGCREGPGRDRDELEQQISSRLEFQADTSKPECPPLCSVTAIYMPTWKESWIRLTLNANFE